jgi:hypothetical protein
VAGALYLLVHGCEAGSGGAVELSWKLRPDSSAIEDKFVDCDPDTSTPDYKDRGAVTRIRLLWTVVDDHGVPVPDGTDSTSWNCNDNHGVTKFSLPEGTASLTLVPDCTSGGMVCDADPATYITPAPVERQVMSGDTISLGAVELIVTSTACDVHRCICGLPVPIKTPAGSACDPATP